MPTRSPNVFHALSRLSCHALLSSFSATDTPSLLCLILQERLTFSSRSFSKYHNSTDLPYANQTYHDLKHFTGVKQYVFKDLNFNNSDGNFILVSSCLFVILVSMSYNVEFYMCIGYFEVSNYTKCT
ncbi:hypothetical protein WN51_02117 [Melipona quadrifasciata]|uniref:Uncharacterized protein n=1 Tax=Melipona quadrifasciata TaxID=166423 RepID=A0A0N0BEZ2_9HYME|nr:hypothetical protein WN51_02117 [Melipona quadrifasciata]